MIKMINFRHYLDLNTSQEDQSEPDPCSGNPFFTQDCFEEGLTYPFEVSYRLSSYEWRKACCHFSILICVSPTSRFTKAHRDALLGQICFKITTSFFSSFEEPFKPNREWQRLEHANREQSYCGTWSYTQSGP